VHGTPIRAHSGTSLVKMLLGVTATESHPLTGADCSVRIVQSGVNGSLAPMGCDAFQAQCRAMLYQKEAGVTAADDAGELAVRPPGAPTTPARHRP
jgi:hypothetical protein